MLKIFNIFIPTSIYPFAFVLISRFSETVPLQCSPIHSNLTKWPSVAPHTNFFALLFLPFLLAWTEPSYGPLHFMYMMEYFCCDE